MVVQKKTRCGTLFNPMQTGVRPDRILSIRERRLSGYLEPMIPKTDRILSRARRG